MILYLQPWWVDNMPKNFWAQFFWICMKIYLIVSLICSCLFNQKEKKNYPWYELICLWMCCSLQTNSDFDAKPMVMLLGQYSTGKTTFIKHLLRSSYPGDSLSHSHTHTHSVHARACVCVCGGGVLSKNCFVSLYWFPLYFATGAHIGPEPTTDRFVVVMV
jgi:hypothetical protein